MKTYKTFFHLFSPAAKKIFRTIETQHFSEDTMIHVLIEPENITVTFPKINSVLQLLNRLQRRPTGVLVIRDGCLLTPDCKVNNEDHIIIRDVTSRG